MVRRAILGPHRYFAWLDQTELSRSHVGGKASSLSRLATLGAPVPTAAALTTSAYEAFSASLGLPRRAADVEIDDLPDIHYQLLTAPLPPALVETFAEIHARFSARFGEGLSLAVRSSATAEDSATLSFAGLHDTILDVRTPDALERAIRECWASLWSERAVAYRLASGLGHEIATIAVVIQQLVRSDVSFVVFTADPVSGNDDDVVISASWGLGEAIVSGLVVPDHVVVGRDGRVRDYTIGGKQVMVIAGAGADGGTREVAVPRALRSMPALSEAQATMIAAMARDLSHRLGYPADLEGGIAGNEVFLFQARPITTLVTQPETPRVTHLVVQPVPEPAVFS